MIKLTNDTKGLRSFIIKNINIKYGDLNCPKNHVTFVLMANPFEEKEFSIAFDFFTTCMPQETQFYIDFLNNVSSSLSLMSDLYKAFYIFTLKNCFKEFNDLLFEEVLKESIEDIGYVYKVGEGIIILAPQCCLLNKENGGYKLKLLPKNYY